MNKSKLRVVAAVIAAVLIMSQIAGCGGRGADDDSTGFEPPEFVFVPEFISLPAGIESISHLVLIGDKLFFSSQDMDEDTFEYTTRIFSMNIDGSGVAELENYALSRPADLPENAMGNEFLNNMFADGDGNLWVVESSSYYGFDLPEDFDEESDDMRERFNYYYEISNDTAVRKLDHTGAELLTVDITSISSGLEYFYISTISVDGDSNVYIAAERTIYVLDNSGRMQFKLEVENWVDQLFRMPDGSVAFSGYMEQGRALMKIDFASRDWGEAVDLPQNAYQIYPGGGSYTFLFSDNTNLFGFDESTGDSEKLLNWIDSDIGSENISNLTMLPDGRVLATSQSWDMVTGRSSVELIIFTKTPYANLPPRTVLTLAAVWLDWTLRNAIVEFNKTNEQYRIQVIDYSEFNTDDDWQAGLTRLTTELISGNVPDMLQLTSLPFNQYVARGLFEDLYRYIDADPAISRGDFVEAAFRATEINGGLYQIFPNFSIQTLVGHPSVLGPEMGWNMEEFMAVLRANPDADIPMGQGMTKGGVLQTLIMMGMGEYVDWAAGRVNFDNDGFAAILEFANTFPEEYSWDEDTYVSEFDLIASGQQIMMRHWVSDFRGTQMYRAIFGGQIVFKGYPSENRSGNSISAGSGIAMTTRCSDKDGAWAFMRTIISEDWQRTNMRWNFPTNKVVFDELLVEAMTPQTYTDEDGNEVEVSMGGWGMNGFSIEIYAVTQEEADEILALINSVSGDSGYDENLMTIITEGAEDYFSGRSSVQDAIRVIQSRASIYVAEQS